MICTNADRPPYNLVSRKIQCYSQEDIYSWYLGALCVYAFSMNSLRTDLGAGRVCLVGKLLRAARSPCLLFCAYKPSYTIPTHLALASQTVADIAHSVESTSPCHAQLLHQDCKASMTLSLQDAISAVGSRHKPPRARQETNQNNERSDDIIITHRSTKP